MVTMFSFSKALRLEANLSKLAVPSSDSSWCRDGDAWQSLYLIKVNVVETLMSIFKFKIFIESPIRLSHDKVRN